jgi:hypothetical protein
MTDATAATDDVTVDGRAAAGGYTVVVPPGWCRIPLRHGTNAAIKNVLDRSFRHLPRDRVAPYRLEIERRLKALVAQSRSNAGLDLYFPVDAAADGPVPASFLVSEARYSPAEDGEPDQAGRAVDPAQVLAYLASESPGARIVDADGAPGLRAEQIVRPAADAEFQYATRRVEYTLAVPGSPGRWLVVAFSTPGSADPDGPLARLLTELFDAIMLTFRWVPVAGQPRTQDVGAAGNRARPRGADQ